MLNDVPSDEKLLKSKALEKSFHDLTNNPVEKVLAVQLLAFEQVLGLAVAWINRSKSAQASNYHPCCVT